MVARFSHAILLNIKLAQKYSTSIALALHWSAVQSCLAAPANVAGRSEVWQSLGTDHERIATVRCVSLSPKLEAEWEKQWEARQAGVPAPVTGDLAVTVLSY